MNAGRRLCKVRWLRTLAEALADAVQQPLLGGPLLLLRLALPLGLLLPLCSGRRGCVAVLLCVRSRSPSVGSLRRSRSRRSSGNAEYGDVRGAGGRVEEGCLDRCFDRRCEVGAVARGSERGDERGERRDRRVQDVIEYLRLRACMI